MESIIAALAWGDTVTIREAASSLNNLLKGFPMGIKLTCAGGVVIVSTSAGSEEVEYTRLLQGENFRLSGTMTQIYFENLL